MPLGWSIAWSPILDKSNNDSFTLHPVQCLDWCLRSKFIIFIPLKHKWQDNDTAWACDGMNWQKRMEDFLSTVSAFNYFWICQSFLHSTRIKRSISYLFTIPNTPLKYIQVQIRKSYEGNLTTEPCFNRSRASAIFHYWFTLYQMAPPKDVENASSEAIKTLVSLIASSSEFNPDYNIVAAEVGISHAKNV